MSESFSELFEQSLANQRIKPGQILTGQVISVGDDMVIVNVGLKSEANIPIEQFRNEPDLPDENSPAEEESHRSEAWSPG